MDQIKIGRLIAEKRKEQSLTQADLAERLGITDRAVSKWECGKSLPDASIMLDLCKLLGITVNDLLSGEVVSMENYNKQTEENLLALVKQKEEADKRLLRSEIVIGYFAIFFMLTMVFLAGFLEMASWLRMVICGVGFVVSFIGILFALRLEQIAGYYQCQKCGHKYVPSYTKVLFSLHLDRTRYMKCPACGKKSWQKKVISKD